MAVRTYSYGAKEPTENEQIVGQQIARAHRYYNVLIDIERERQAKFALATTDGEKDFAQEASKAAVREARSRSGCYWGTYLLSEAAAKQSAEMCFTVLAKEDGGCSRCKKPVPAGMPITITKSKREGKKMCGCAACGNGPRHRLWDGTGNVAVQLQGGLPVSELINGDDTRVRLLGEGKHRTLRLRVGSTGIKPVWASFPVVYHRDLPAEAVISWVRVCSRKCGPHTEWRAQFVVKADDTEFVKAPADKPGTLALDVGFRNFEEAGLRVAVGIDSGGQVIELRLPYELARRHEKVEDLKGIRSKNFNIAREAIAEARRTQSDWPAWFLADTETLHAWRSEERLAGLVWRWKDRRWDGDAALYDAAEAWRKQDKHLWTWESAQRERILRQRREIYRLFAVNVAARYPTVVAECLDLSRLAEDVAEDLPRGPRGNRFDAALASLLDACASAVKAAGGEWLEVDPKNTTRECNVCGQVEPEAVGPALEHTCTSCGAVWDQDLNAAKNIVSRAARGCVVTHARSRAKKAATTGESAVSLRRKAGKAAQRARRSQEASEVPEETED